MTGDELVARISTAADESSLDAAAKALLQECFRGYPPEKLRPLLNHPRNEVVKVAVWVVSELGERGQPLLRDVSALLAHDVAYVRFFAIDCVLSSSTESDAAVIARVVTMLSDADSSVRWKATQFLMRASLEKLRAAMPHVSASDFAGLRLLTDETVPEESVMSMLRSDVPGMRRFALAAAYRRREMGEAALRAAALSEDSEVREIAQRELDRDLAEGDRGDGN
jgi:hypothetical protein